LVFKVSDSDTFADLRREQLKIKPCYAKSKKGTRRCLFLLLDGKNARGVAFYPPSSKRKKSLFVWWHSTGNHKDKKGGVTHNVQQQRVEKECADAQK